MQEANRCKGLGLIEALAVMAILAIVLAAGLPSFQGLLVQQRVAGVATELASDLAYLRSEAVSRGTATRISFHDTEAGSCYVLHDGGPTACHCTATQTAVCTNSAQAFKVVVLPASLQARISANVSSLAYHPAFGTVTPTGSITIEGPQGFALRHVVNLMGRVRTCAPERRWGAYRPC